MGMEGCVLRKSKAAGPGWAQLLTLTAPLLRLWAVCSMRSSGIASLVLDIFLRTVGLEYRGM